MPGLRVGRVLWQRFEPAECWDENRHRLERRRRPGLEWPARGASGGFVMEGRSAWPETDQEPPEMAGTIRCCRAAGDRCVELRSKEALKTAAAHL